MAVFSDKTILVTGASRNIGFYCAKLLATQGAQIIATARTVGGLEALDDAVTEIGGKKPVLVPLDLNDGAKIDALGASIFERFGKLDGMILNAGIIGGALTPLAHISPDNFQTTLNINLTANYRLIRSLEMPLKQSDKSAILAIIDKKPQPFWGHYHAAKAGLIGLLECYQQEMANTSLRVDVFQPSPTATRLRKTAFPGEDANNLQQPAQSAEQIIAHFATLFS